MQHGLSETVGALLHLPEPQPVARHQHPQHLWAPLGGRQQERRGDPSLCAAVWVGPTLQESLQVQGQAPLRALLGQVAPAGAHGPV